jgi:hypothetical protein
MQDNYPDMHITCLNMSPCHLERSHKNMDYWRRMRAQASPKNTTDTFIQVPGRRWCRSQVSTLQLGSIMPEKSCMILNMSLWKLQLVYCTILTSRLQLRTCPSMTTHTTWYAAWHCWNYCWLVQCVR